MVQISHRQWASLYKLAEDARNNDLEISFSKFWQVWLQITFPTDEGYIVTCEQPPDASRRRVDIKVEKLDPIAQKFSLIVLAEAKRAGGSVKEVERQGLDAGKKALEHTGYNGVYILTTHGLGFRFWYLGQGDEHLFPMEGETSPGGKKQKSRYRGILDQEVNRQWWEDVAMLKGDAPIGTAPTLPSQADQLFGINLQGYTSYSNAYDDQSITVEAGPSDVQGHDTQQSAAASTAKDRVPSPTPTDEDTVMGQDPSPVHEHGAQQDATRSAGEEEAGDIVKRLGARTLVNTTTKSQTKHGVKEYSFNTEKGKMKRSKASEWVKYKQPDGSKWRYFYDEERAVLYNAPRK